MPPQVVCSPLSGAIYYLCYRETLPRGWDILPRRTDAVLLLGQVRTGFTRCHSPLFTSSCTLVRASLGFQLFDLFRTHVLQYSTVSFTYLWYVVAGLLARYST